MSSPAPLRRLLHTSRAAAQSPRLYASGSNSGRFGSSSSDLAVQETARAFIRSSGTRSEVDIGRSTFYTNQTISPQHLSRPSLYPTDRPNARPPLLGPPKRIAKKIDPFHASSTTPLDFTLNPLFPLSFVNQMGRIKSRAETGLTWKNQRMVGKMVRRARAMGLISRWSNWPSTGGYGSDK